MLGRVDVGEPSKEPRLAGAYDADLSFRSCVARVRNLDQVEIARACRRDRTRKLVIAEAH